MSLYLMGSSVVSSLVATAFNTTPLSRSINGKFGSIFVPASLLAQYKSARNWKAYSSRMVGI